MKTGISVCVATMVLLYPASGACQQPSGGKEVVQNIDYLANDTASIADLARAADLIVRGVVTATRVKAVRDAEAEPIPEGAAGGIGEVPDVYTELTVRVDAVVKGQVAAGSEVTVLQRAGEMEWRGYRVRVDPGDFPSLTEGADYVLLLRRHTVLDAFVIRPDDVFSLAESKVQTPGRSKAVRALAGVSVEELLLALQGAAK
jgi:hypothetical protein